MTVRTKNGKLPGILATAAIAALGIGATILIPYPADARVFVGFGFGFPIGFPGYYYPPYLYPYYPPPPYYPAPAYHAPSAGYQPSAAYQSSAGYTPSAGFGSSAPAAPPITYTPRPGWTNAQGEYCREYKSSQGTGNSATDKYGTACRDGAGQWRIVN